ncbi:Neuropeptide S [Myotis brandtii]|uniref:Neuropeptide S n=2 Tax=Myotis brandtii TaxID=109478 RepID=S7Q9X9_MYOBR|nr:Neuropeptide S [Myotis brandtii]
MGRDGISTPELSRYKRAAEETRRRDSECEGLAREASGLQRFGASEMISSLKFNLILVLSVSAMPVFWCYPAPSPKVSGTPDYALLLLGCCRARAGPGEGLDVRKPLLEEAFAKRSFRNGVGTGLKKTPFPRAKS